MFKHSSRVFVRQSVDTCPRHELSSICPTILQLVPGGDLCGGGHLAGIFRVMVSGHAARLARFLFGIRCVLLRDMIPKRVRPLRRGDLACAYARTRAIGQGVTSSMWPLAMKVRVPQCMANVVPQQSGSSQGMLGITASLVAPSLLTLGPGEPQIDL